MSTIDNLDFNSAVWRRINSPKQLEETSGLGKCLKASKGSPQPQVVGFFTRLLLDVLPVIFGVSEN